MTRESREAARSRVQALREYFGLVARGEDVGVEIEMEELGGEMEERA